MIEPTTSPTKIPVLMIHGLWSSPVTWMEMFNDLQASRELRENYQFWFYVYPTGQPFWQSAAQLRQTLAALHATLDPEHRSVALDQMVLVGHSMGGLVARLQTLDSGDDFWRLVSAAPLPMLKADSTERDGLAATYFFGPNPSIRRVITIATPFRGSAISNGTTQWIGRKLISISDVVAQREQQLRRENPGLFVTPSLIDVSTSIDSLSPQSAILPVMLSVPQGPWVTYHNVVGKLARRKTAVGRLSGETATARRRWMPLDSRASARRADLGVGRAGGPSGMCQRHPLDDSRSSPHLARAKRPNCGKSLWYHRVSQENGAETQATISAGDGRVARWKDKAMQRSCD